MNVRDKRIDPIYFLVAGLVIVSIFKTVSAGYCSFFDNGFSINCLEPFIAIANTWEIIPLTIAGTIFNTIMFKRKGDARRNQWDMFSHFVYSGLFVVVIIILLFLFVIPVAYVGRKWSFSCIKNRIGIPVYLYTQKTPVVSFVYSILLVYALINMFSLIVKFCTIINKRTYGITMIAIISALNIYSCYKGYVWKWILPLSNANLAEHYEAIYIGSVFPLWYSFLYFGFICLLITCLVQGHKHKVTKETSNEQDKIN